MDCALLAAGGGEQLERSSLVDGLEFSVGSKPWPRYCSSWADMSMCTWARSFLRNGENGGVECGDLGEEKRIPVEEL